MLTEDCPKPDKNIGIVPDETRPAEPLQVPELTPQDKGEPSPVPYTLMVQKPSGDLPQDGVEKIYFRGAFENTGHLTAYLLGMFSDSKLMAFIENAFNYKGIYRLEIVIGDWSIKVYKHPNNP